MDPEEHIISEDEHRDLAILDLTSLLDKAEDLTESKFVQPAVWPPRSVSKEDVLCLAGYPGIWREQPDLGYLQFYSFSSGASEVLSVREELARIDHRFGNEGDFGRPERFSESFAIDPVQVE